MADITLDPSAHGRGRGQQDKPELGPLDKIAARSAWNGTRILAWIIMALLAVGLGWMFYAHLEQVSVAEGEVVPQSKLKVIQHLEGGLIQKLFVQEGDVVQEGTPLV